MRRLVPFGLLLLAVLALAPAPLAAQCAMCRRALLSPEGQQMIAAFRSGILFLLAAPFAVFGVVGTLAIRAQRASTASSFPPCRPADIGAGGANDSSDVTEVVAVP